MWDTDFPDESGHVHISLPAGWDIPYQQVPLCPEKRRLITEIHQSLLPLYPGPGAVIDAAWHRYGIEFTYDEVFTAIKG